MPGTDLTSIVTIGKRGTFVIPVEVRSELGIDCGSALLITVGGGQITLVPVPADPLDRLAWAGRGLFADDADAVIRELRNNWE